MIRRRTKKNESLKSVSKRADHERLDDLESRQAFSEDSIASLNDALVAQQQRIAALEKMLALVIERYREGMADAGPQGEEPPPPHY